MERERDIHLWIYGYLKLYMGAQSVQDAQVLQGLQLIFIHLVLGLHGRQKEI